MTMELLEWVKTLAAIGSLLFSLFTWAYVRSEKRDEAIKSLLDKRDEVLVKRLDKHDNRLSELEDEVSRIPTRHEIEAAREISRQEIVRVHQRLDDIHKDNKQTQLFLGELLGYYKGMTNGKP